MVNPLTVERTAVKDALEANGLKAIDYVQESFTPPVCVVLPNSPYVTAPVGQNPFNEPYSVNLQVLIVGGKGTNRAATEKIDSMLVDVINALDEQWDITEVQAPQEVSLKGIAYLGALVLLNKNTSFEKEVI